MTKNERILRKQIKELERLIEIKDAVIVELRGLIRPTYYPNTIVSPFYPQLPIYGESAGDVVITNGTSGEIIVTTTPSDMPFTLSDESNL